MTKLTKLTTEYRNELINSFRLNNKILELHYHTQQFFTPEALIERDFNYFKEQINEGNWEGFEGSREEFEDFLDEDLANYDELSESKFEIRKNHLNGEQAPTLNENHLN